MKTKNQLQKLLQFFYWLLVLSFFISTALVLYFIFLNGVNPFTEETTISDSPLWLDVIWSSYGMVFSGFIAYGVFHLKKAVSHVLPEKYFSTEVIHHFKKAGDTFIILGIVLIAFHIITQLCLTTALWFLIDTVLFCYAFIFIIGLFFKLFGSIFIKGQSLQTETELTI